MSKKNRHKTQSPETPASQQQITDDLLERQIKEKLQQSLAEQTMAEENRPARPKAPQERHLRQEPPRQELPMAEEDTFGLLLDGIIADAGKPEKTEKAPVPLSEKTEKAPGSSPERKKEESFPTRQQALEKKRSATETADEIFPETIPAAKPSAGELKLSMPKEEKRVPEMPVLVLQPEKLQEKKETLSPLKLVPAADQPKETPAPGEKPLAPKAAPQELSFAAPETPPALGSETSKGKRAKAERETAKQKSRHSKVLSKAGWEGRKESGGGTDLLSFAAPQSLPQQEEKNTAFAQETIPQWEGIGLWEAPDRTGEKPVLEEVFPQWEPAGKRKTMEKQPSKPTPGPTTEAGDISPRQVKTDTPASSREASKAEEREPGASAQRGTAERTAPASPSQTQKKELDDTADLLDILSALLEDTPKAPGNAEATQTAGPKKEPEQPPVTQPAGTPARKQHRKNAAKPAKAEENPPAQPPKAEEWKRENPAQVPKAEERKREAPAQVSKAEEREPGASAQRGTAERTAPASPSQTQKKELDDTADLLDILSALLEDTPKAPGNAEATQTAGPKKEPEQPPVTQPAGTPARKQHRKNAAKPAKAEENPPAQPPKAEEWKRENPAQPPKAEEREPGEALLDKPAKASAHRLEDTGELLSELSELLSAEPLPQAEQREKPAAQPPEDRPQTAEKGKSSRRRRERKDVLEEGATRVMSELPEIPDDLPDIVNEETLAVEATEALPQGKLSQRQQRKVQRAAKKAAKKQAKVKTTLPAESIPAPGEENDPKQSPTQERPEQENAIAALLSQELQERELEETLTRETAGAQKSKAPAKGPAEGNTLEAWRKKREQSREEKRFALMTQVEQEAKTPHTVSPAAQAEQKLPQQPEVIRSEKAAPPSRPEENAALKPLHPNGAKGYAIHGEDAALFQAIDDLLGSLPKTIDHAPAPYVPPLEEDAKPAVSPSVETRETASREQRQPAEKRLPTDKEKAPSAASRRGLRGWFSAVMSPYDDEDDEDGGEGNRPKREKDEKKPQKGENRPQRMPQEAGQAQNGPERTPQMPPEGSPRQQRPAPPRPDQGGAVTLEQAAAPVRQRTGAGQAAPVRQTASRPRQAQGSGREGEPSGQRQGPGRREDTAQSSRREGQPRQRPVVPKLEEHAVLHPEEAYRQYSKQLGTVGPRMVVVAFLTAISIFLTLAIHFAWRFMPQALTGKSGAYILAGLLVVMAAVSHDVFSGAVRQMKKRKFSMDCLLLPAVPAVVLDTFSAASQGRAPLCAVAGLLLLFSLWGRYDGAMAVMTTTRTITGCKTPIGIAEVPDTMKGRRSICRCPGETEKFMAQLEQTDPMTKTLRLYVPAAAVLSLVGAVWISLQAKVGFFWVLSLLLMGAMPMAGFLGYSRLYYLVSRRLAQSGAALCGWYGARVFGGDHSILVQDDDILPPGSLRLNGLKAYAGDIDRTISYTEAVLRTIGSPLHPLFVELLDSRGGRRYTAEKTQWYATGGTGADIGGNSVLLGSLECMRRMGVHMDASLRVHQALYVAVNGELAAVFALKYRPDEALGKGLAAVVRNRHFKIILATRCFMVTPSFLHQKYGIPLSGVLYPGVRERGRLLQMEMAKSGKQGALLTRDSFGGFAEAAAGGRVLRTAAKLLTAMTVLAGVLSLVILAVLTAVASFEAANPVNLLLYLLVWAVPTLLLSGWGKRY